MDDKPVDKPVTREEVMQAIFGLMDTVLPPSEPDGPEWVKLADLMEARGWTYDQASARIKALERAGKMESKKFGHFKYVRIIE